MIAGYQAQLFIADRVVGSVYQAVHQGFELLFVLRLNSYHHAALAFTKEVSIFAELAVELKLKAQFLRHGAFQQGDE